VTGSNDKEDKNDNCTIFRIPDELRDEIRIIIGSNPTIDRSKLDTKRHILTDKKVFYSQLSYHRPVHMM
jgi:hypothetical protein